MTSRKAAGGGEGEESRWACAIEDFADGAVEGGGIDLRGVGGVLGLAAGVAARRNWEKFQSLRTGSGSGKTYVCGGRPVSGLINHDNLFRKGCGERIEPICCGSVVVGQKGMVWTT